MFEDYQSKPSVTVIYTGDGKGKTSAGLGLVARALGTGWKVAFLQFIKNWEVGEHQFLKDISSVYENHLFFYEGGEGFYDAGEMSAAGVSDAKHKHTAQNTYKLALKSASSGEFQLVVCDEINNAVHDGLLEWDKLEKLITTKHEQTSLCLTGRNFPQELLDDVDIATNMTKLKHHFDDKFLANKGIDY